MDHNEHKTVHLAEAKPPLSDLRALESSGEFWRALASSGELWRALASSGELWRVLESSGELWRALESSGELWRALESSGELLRALESSGEFWRTLESSPELHMLGWKNCGCALHIYFRASYWTGGPQIPPFQNRVLELEQLETDWPVSF